MVIRFQDLNSSVIVDICDGVLLNRWNALCRGIVIVKVRRFSHTRRRRHQSHRFVVSEPSAAAPALDDAHETASEFLVEERVQDGIYAGIGRAEPLGDRRRYRQDFLFPGLDLAAEFDAREYDVERQPGEDE